MTTAERAATVREATREDLPRIVEIYNHYIEHSVATFDLEPFAVEQREAWFELFGGEDPLLVAEIDGRVAGFAYYLPYRPRRAYARTKESTIYLDPGAAGRGVGSLLYARLIALARKRGVHTLVGVLGGRNEASEALHEKFGFKRVGALHEAGFKFGRWVDTVTYQLMLEE